MLSAARHSFCGLVYISDIVFHENDVRLIAVNDNVDSAVWTEFDMTPIRNFCNELYARDTAKKIKSTFRMKGESGKGADSYGVQGAERGKLLPTDPYKWAQKTVAAIFDLQELIESDEQEQHNLQQFLKNVRKYTDPEERTAEILRDLVDKIVVHAPDKSSGHRKQKIEMRVINIAEEDCVALDGRLGMQNRKNSLKTQNGGTAFGCTATLHKYLLSRLTKKGSALICILETFCRRQSDSAVVFRKALAIKDVLGNRVGSEMDSIFKSAPDFAGNIVSGKVPLFSGIMPKPFLTQSV